MEFRSIVPNCGEPAVISRQDRINVLKSILERALEVADDLGLELVGIDLDLALHHIHHTAA